MNNNENNLITLLDLLDLDEEAVDSHLEKLMSRKSFSNKHLSAALTLIKYKLLINSQDGDECDNTKEYNFLAKLLTESGDWDIEIVRKITSCVLSLQPSSLVTKAEHLLQQIFYKLFENVETTENTAVTRHFYLSVCNSILDAVIQNEQKISLMFLEIPFENILSCGNEKFQTQFLMETTPLLSQAALDYHILDQIWSFIKNICNNNICLKVLSTLSEFYLPVPEENVKTTIESNLVHENQFWQIVLCGMNSHDPFERKSAIYLAKRSIDSINIMRTDVKVVFDGKLLFEWNTQNSVQLNIVWHSFFILLESLEETQSNIVLPSIKLFDTIQVIGSDWLDCVFKLGLRHDNGQVRLKCIQYRIKHKINSIEHARVLLEALNDVNMYINGQGVDIMDTLVLNEDKARLLSLIHEVNLSPIPLYHFSTALEKSDCVLTVQEDTLIGHICDILRISCNEVTLRLYVHFNLISFIVKNYKEISCDGFIKIVNALPYHHRLKQLDELLVRFTVQSDFKCGEKVNILKYFIVNLNSSVLTMHYCMNVEEFRQFVLQQIDMKFENIHNVLKRQYCNRTACLEDFIYISKIYKDSLGHDNLREVYEKVVNEFQSLLQYAFELISTEEYLSTANMVHYQEICSVLLAKSLKSADALSKLAESYQLVYKIVKDSNCLQQKVMSLIVLNQMLKYNFDTIKIKHGIETSAYINLITAIHNKVFNGDGKIKNMLQMELCETLLIIVENNQDEVEFNISNIIDFTDHITESCGYDPLPIILKIIKIIMPTIIETKAKYNITRFIDRMWNEIKSIKTNELHEKCMKQLIALITENSLLQSPAYNNVVMLYCTRILEDAAATPVPLKCLVDEMYNMEFNENSGHVLFIYHEILLFAPVPRKDERILRRTIQHLKDDIESLLYCNNTELIQATAIKILLKISDVNIVQQLINLIAKKIEGIFKNLKRYHANSHTHRVAQAALQHVLFTLMLHGRSLETCDLVTWAVKLLCKLPHQTSVKICLEWILSVCFYLKGLEISEQNLKYIRFDEIPLVSQLTIIYLLAKHKMSHALALHRCEMGDCVDEEYEFCMDFLLSHTMGQLFNVRLQAQYLATNLYKLSNQKNNKYNFTIKLIEDNFKQSSSEKCLLKLQQDYFANNFDIVRSLTPSFIYNALPKYFSENNDLDSISDRSLAVIIEKIKSNNNFKAICDLWSVYNEYSVIAANSAVPLEPDTCDEASGSIQKKYIPWKNMSDVATFGEKKKASPSELVVVASLVDKLPNLGGLARTGEVLGVRACVVPSLRQLQDRQFQGLSMSAERWLDIEEVRPGRALKDYLVGKRREGYSLVAAEQTSASVALQTFRFPRKMVLVLGHEKEGIPCDLLPLMDACVEVPQRGVVRSLNVHVTAAIFVWEYSRQNLLV